MAEIDGYDLDRSTAQAWAEFPGRLAEVISMMDESGDLTIGTDSASTDAPFVRLCSPGRLTDPGRGRRQRQLGPSFQLTEAQTEPRWRKRGGARPMRTARTSGSRCPRTRPTRWLSSSSGPCGTCTASSTRCSSNRTSWPRCSVRPRHRRSRRRHRRGDRDVAGERPGRPGRRPRARSTAGRGVAMIAVLPADRDHLDALVETELGERSVIHRSVTRRATSSSGSAPPWSSCGPPPTPRTSCCSPPSCTTSPAVARATEVLNDLNVESRWVKFQLVRDRVFVITSVPARPFVPAHLHQAVQVMSDVADGVDDELAAKLGGRTTFGGDA